MTTQLQLINIVVIIIIIIIIIFKIGTSAILHRSFVTFHIHFNKAGIFAYPT